MNSLNGLEHGDITTRHINARGELEQSDVILYIGGVADIYSIPTDELIELKKRSKLVLICVEAGNPGWHPLLAEYNARNVFDLMVNIDGHHHPHCLNLLGCVDKTPYLGSSLGKDILVGHSNSAHSSRTKLIDELAPLVTCFGRTDTTQEYADFLKRSKFTLNTNFIGDDRVVMGVNLKTIEAGYAKSLLIEKKNPITEKWFTPGMHYIEYDTADDVRQIVDWLSNDHDTYAEIIDNMARHIDREYSPAKFWSKVFKSL